MLKLQWALWRRDVAARKLLKVRRKHIKYAHDHRRIELLVQRMRRWERIATMYEQQST